MRPVNLIPGDQRRAGKAPVRTGPIAYVLVGALALGLILVTVLVLTTNTVSDHKAEVSDLKGQVAAAQARASQLAPFSNFASLEQSRHSTVKNLADSRFDWERVMNELARVLPGNVWLTHLSGAASSSSGTSATGGSDTSVTGPSLQISGCATSQDAVAGFLSALRDIDGVTRVGLTSSERGGSTTSGGGAATADSAGGASSGTATDCRTRSFIAQFEIVVAFDKAPTPASAAAGAAPAPAPAPTTTPPATTTPATTTPPASGTESTTASSTTP